MTKRTLPELTILDHTLEQPSKSRPRDLVLVTTLTAIPPLDWANYFCEATSEYFPSNFQLTPPTLQGAEARTECAVQSLAAAVQDLRNRVVGSNRRYLDEEPGFPDRHESPMGEPDVTAKRLLAAAKLRGV